MKSSPYLYLLGITFLLLSCTFYDKKTISAIDFYGNSQYFDRGRIVDLPTHIKIFFYGDLTLYEISSKNTHRSMELGSKGDVIDKGITKVETVVSYYVAKKGETHGLVYNSSVGRSKTKFNVDSLLTYSNIGKENEKLFASDFGKVVLSIKDKNNNISLEKIELPKKPNSADSVFRFFDYKMMNINFSLSNELDKKYNTKLVKIVFVTNEKKVDGLMIPKLETFFEIRKPIRIENEKRIISIFKQFKKDLSLGDNTGMKK